MKLGGAVLPYPSTCRMPRAIPPNASFVSYTGADAYDYPSIGQLATAIREQEIIPIFATTRRQENIYQVSLYQK